MAVLSMEQILNDYYKNGGEKLHKLVNQIINKTSGGTADKDMDEFYSVANDVFADIVLHNRYNSSKGNFDDFLYGALCLAIIDEFKKQNRDKRTTKIEVIDENGNLKKISVPNVYLESAVDGYDNLTIGDTIKSDYNLEDETFRGLSESDNENIREYISTLTPTQKKIAELIGEGLSKNEIIKKIRISESAYNNNLKAMRHFEKVRILKSSIKSEEDELMMSVVTQTMENCKTDKISIASIIKKIDKHTIRFDHPLQRDSEQWTPAMKGNLVSDILQGNRLHPLIFAEQIINGVAIIWDLDGKQRCTNAYSFVNNGYKISKNIRRWNIKYQTTEKDENGNEILDENGFPIAKNEEFDIRGKKFLDLPEELQEKFLDYTFNYDQYLNCSEEEIGYHSERYNDGKPMNKAQKGITKIGTEFAEMVKSISNMSFFRDRGGYKVSEFNNGTINRVVVESVMAANYFDDWKKDLEDQCKYIKDNSTTDTFDNFEDMVNRLERVVTDEVADMFDSKDSFLYFGLFAKFVDTGLDDKKFIEFMAEFSRSLHSKVVNGMSYDELCINKKTGKAYGTKDKYVVTPKMEILETLMNDFLHIENQEDITQETFISEIVGMPVDTVKEELNCYEETLDELENNNIRVGSKLLDVANRVSLLAMVAYSYKNDVDLDDWLEEYAANNNTYFMDQRKNYSHMINDFKRYQKRIAVA